RFAEANINVAKPNQKLSNILFEIKVNNSKKCDYKWVFNPNDFWFQTFTHLSTIRAKMEERLLPIFYTKQLGSLLECTDKEGFHYQLSLTNLDMINVLNILPDDLKNNGLLFAKMVRLVT